MELRFFVSRRKLTCKGPSAPIADGKGSDTFSIDFDPEWDGLVKLVELRNGERTAQVFYTGKMPLPRQVCGRGELRLTCYGYAKKGDHTAVIVTLPMVQPVRLVGGAVPDGSMDQPYTPSAFDQMAAEVRHAVEAAREARSTAKELMDMKDRGLFNGPAGQAATVQVESLRRGTPPKVENLGSAQHALLRFTLPLELSEEEKTQLKAELLGDVELALDEILALQAKYLEGDGSA